MSWGYKLMATYIVFAAMMGYLVYRCYGTNFELVEKEYYKSELKYQDIIDGTVNTGKLTAVPKLKQSHDRIVLQMPEEMKSSSLSGAVLFYCPYNSKNDRTFSLAVDRNGIQSFNQNILSGNYIVKITWMAGGKKYYSERTLTVL